MITYTISAVNPATLLVNDAPSITFEVAGIIREVYTGESGPGDMIKSVYDANNNGIVDNAEKLDGKTPDQLSINGGYF